MLLLVGATYLRHVIEGLQDLSVLLLKSGRRPTAPKVAYPLPGAVELEDLRFFGEPPGEVLQGVFQLCLDLLSDGNDSDLIAKETYELIVECVDPEDVFFTRVEKIEETGINEVGLVIEDAVAESPQEVLVVSRMREQCVDHGVAPVD